jgi:hypothetical protein
VAAFVVRAGWRGAAVRSLVVRERPYPLPWRRQASNSFRVVPRAADPSPATESAEAAAASAGGDSS